MLDTFQMYYKETYLKKGLNGQERLFKYKMSVTLIIATNNISPEM